MEQLLNRILAQPCLQQSQLAGAAIRGAMAHDARHAFAGLSAWSAHKDPHVRTAAAIGFGQFATHDRDALGEVVPFLERLANDPEPAVRRHGAQAALQQIWLAHADAVESVAEAWARNQNDAVREVVVRTIADIAVGGQFRRPSILRRFIERGLALCDVAAHEASAEVRAVIAEAVNEIGCMAPNLVTPQLGEWAAREDVETLRLVADIARLPVAELCPDVDFRAAAERLRKHQAVKRIRATRWARQGIGAIQFPQFIARSILRPAAGDGLPWAHGADPYRGCQLRCEFCNARSLTEWSGDDPESFVRRVTVVRNAAELLAKELALPAMSPRGEHVVGIGIESDPYQPAEEKAEVVRDMLKVCLDVGHPVVIQTRQSLILRDLDVLEALAEKHLVNVLVAMVAPIEGIRSKIEVGTSTVAERFRTIGMLARKEIPVGLLLSPIMPELTDDASLIDDTLRRAAEAGARWVVAETLDLRGSAGVKVRLFLDNYVSTLLPRYDEIFGSTEEGVTADAAWRKHVLGTVVAEARAKRKLDDTSRMLTCGKDAASLLVRS